MISKVFQLSAAEAMEVMNSGNFVTDGKYLYSPVNIRKLDGSIWYAIGAFETFDGDPVKLIPEDDWTFDMEGESFQEWKLIDAFEAKEALANNLCVRNVDGDYIFLREIEDPLGNSHFWVFSLNPEKGGLRFVCYLDAFACGENASERKYYIYEEDK